MNTEQLQSLEPALREFLGEFRPCFRKRVTFGYLSVYVLGLLADIARKSIEPIALAANVAVRTLQEFLADFKWNHARAEVLLHHRIAARGVAGVGVIDASGYPKKGDKTPGVQRQWCGQSGKIDNCVVGQHLLWTDNDPANPFSAMLCSDLYLPKSWADDPARRKEARIPDECTCLTKWRIAIGQIERAVGNGVAFSALTFDEEYGSVPSFWYELDRLGQRGCGEVRPNFLCWTTPPKYTSLQSGHAPKRVDSLVKHSPAFKQQPWRTVNVKTTTRGAAVWRIKHAMVQLPDTPKGKNTPTDRRYWLIWAESRTSDVTKYFLSNAPASADVEDLLRIAFGRWHVEKWFERAKQQAGLGAFEVRTHTGLIRHWLCSQIAMLFLAEQTTRLRGEKSADHL
jgi:SRSO17 transposase